MDSPTLELVFKNHQKQHKLNPIILLGELAQKRRDITQKTRKSHRLGQFDYSRGILPVTSRVPSTEKLTDNEIKAQQRRIQLEKWKEEREKQKKEMMQKKKKPFVSAVAPKAIPIVPPPIPSKAGTSATRRVTRSQANKKNNEEQKEKDNIKFDSSKFNLPKNVMFTGNYNEKFKVPLITFSKPSNELKATSVTFEPLRHKNILKPVNHDREQNKRKTETKNVTNKLSDTKKHSIESTSSSSSIEKPEIKIKRTVKDKNRNIATTKSIPVKSNVLSKKLETKITTDSSSSLDERQNKKPVKVTKNQAQIKELSSLSTQEQPKRSNRLTKSQSQDTQSTKDQNSLSKPEDGQKKRPVRASRTQSLLITKTNEPKVTNKAEDKAKKNNKIVSTPTIGIPKSESSSEERLRLAAQKPISVMTPEELKNTSINSPCVTMSRGKDRARKEMKMKIKEGLLDLDASHMEDISSFRVQLDSEISRLTALSDHWEETLEDSTLPVFGQEQILSAVGLARLLMSSKLKQFEDLMKRCEARDVSAGLITPADLQGFWDMVFIQIVNVDMKFQQLKQLQSRNWVEATVMPQKPQAREVKAVKPKPVAQSKLKDMIAARRKANQQPSNSTQLHPEHKTFEGGFFRVTSPVRSPNGPITPRNNTMLKNVLSTEAKKASANKANTSMAMLRASLFGKNTAPEIEGIEPLPPTPAKTPINLNATPARSILKSTKKDLTAAKLSKMVLFHESDLEQDDDKENFHDASQQVQGADSGVSSMETDKDLSHNEKQQRNKQKKTKLHRQDAIDIDSPRTDRSSYYSSNDATPVHTPVQRAAKVKALQAIDAKLKNKRTPRKIATPKTPKLTDDDVNINTPRRSARLSMRVLN